MTRGRYYGTVMPIWAILYVIGIVAFHNHTFTIVGALVFALLAVLGSVVIRPGGGTGAGTGAGTAAGATVGRDRSDRAARRAARRA